MVRKFLWALAGVAAIAFVWLVWGEDPAVLSSEKSEPPFYAEFNLTDHTGTARTQEDFAGQWMLVFFGFANCPDVCPTTLAEVAAVMNDLGGDAAQVQPLFITVDPDRDTVEALADFVPRFQANIIGLSGTPSQIDQTAESFHIFYEKVEEAATPNRYTMDHSSQLFLFGRDAGYVTSWSYGTRAEVIGGDLRELISP